MFTVRETKLGDSLVTNFPVNPTTVKYNFVYGSGSGLIVSEYSSSYIGTFVPNSTSSKWTIEVKKQYETKFSTNENVVIYLYHVTSSISQPLKAFNYLTSGSNGIISNYTLTSGSQYLIQLIPNNYTNIQNSGAGYSAKYLQEFLSIYPQTGSLIKAGTSSISVNTSSNTFTISTPNTESVAFFFVSSSAIDEETVGWTPYYGTVSYPNFTGSVYVMTMRDNNMVSAFTSASLR